MVTEINKKYVLTALSILGVIILTTLVSAAINVSIGSTSAADSGTNVSTGSGTNYSNASTLTSQTPMLTLNVTFLNNTDFNFNGTVVTVGNINATFYLVTEGVKTWTVIERSINCALVGTTQNYVSCWTNISTGLGNFNISEGRYNITAVLFNNAVGSKNSSNNATMVRFDHTPPINVNITGVPSGQNHSTRSNSGNLTLNVSISDQSGGLNASSGIGSVIFNFINITGNTNRTLNAIREGTGQYWSTSVNTSEFINGKYNITAFVNDTAGNFNSTANSTTTPPIFSLFFDNALPSVSASCTPTSVNTGDTVTCSCSASATSGINSSSITANPSTSDTGTFTQTCSATSRSGLSNTGSASYTVSLAGSGGGAGSGSGGGGGGGSTVSWKTTIPYADKELSEKGAVTKEFSSNTRISLKVEGESHHVGVTSITSDSVTIEVASTPQTATLKIGETKKFDVNANNVYDLSVVLNSITSGKASLVITPISEAVPVSEQPGAGAGEETPGAGEEEGAKAAGKTGWIITIIVIVIVIILVVFWLMKRK